MSPIFSVRFAPIKAAAFATAFLLCSPGLAGAQSKSLDNISVRVVDGDTLAVIGSRTRIRLNGVDACERGQMAATANGIKIDCEKPASDALKAWTQGKPVSCTVVSKDRYDRLLAVCSTPHVKDVAAELIRNGLAVAYRYRGRAVSPEYAELESAARSRKIGIWRFQFDQPWIHRRNNTH